MDAYVQLALIEKATRVFATDAGVILSFPLLTPLSFTSAELAALAAPATAADYAALADFARAANFLPRDIVASASERMLWDIYRDVLTRAEVAVGRGTSAAADDDVSILYDIAADGTRVESQVLTRYRQYRDAWFAAREDYAAHRSTGELSDDPAVRQRWIDVDEPQLRAVLNAAQHDWETLGQRTPIEAALQTERNAALHDPRTRWADWSADFNPDIDMLTDAGGGQFAPTALSPRDFAGQSAWPSFDLSAGEMKALVDGAPAALKAALDDGAGSDIDHVSFEYRSVAFIRPWFHPEALTSQVWRSSDPDLMLSDGADPPNGICPAYAAACVFVRNIKVLQKGVSVGHSFRDLRFTIDPRRLTRRNLQVDRALLTRATPKPAPGASTTAASARIFRALGNASFTLAPRTTPAAIDPIVHGDIHLPRNVFGTPVPTPPPSPPPSPPPPDELSILAFICRRLPQAPDPAPDLRWS
jgi:hypothetical protein